MFAATVVSRVFHLFPAHWLLIIAMFACALGPALFLPQSASSNYWALAMPEILLVTLRPDSSFAAASIFITSQVPRHSQGAAGSLLITLQNVSVAIMTGISDAIGASMSTSDHVGDISLQGLRALWWFQLACALLPAAISSAFVRLPRGQEKDHVL